MLLVAPLALATPRDLIEHPEPDYPLRYQPDAVDEIIRLTHCQPFLVQAVCIQIVQWLNALENRGRREVTREDVRIAAPKVFETYPYYFESVRKSLSDKEKTVLSAVARGDSPSEDAVTVQRLINHDYIEGRDGRCDFQVPLMQEWWACSNST